MEVLLPLKSLVVEICVGTSCHLLGSQELFEAVEALPADQRKAVDLRGVACLQSCGKGPSARVNGTVLTEMTPDRLVGVMRDLLFEEVKLCHKSVK